MKKILSVISMAFILVFSLTPQQSTAVSNIAKEDCQCDNPNSDVQKAIEQLEASGTEVNQELSKKVKKSVNKVAKKDRNSEAKKILKSYKKKGYLLAKDAQTYTQFKNLEDQGVNYENVVSYAAYYYDNNNKDNKKILREIMWIDLKEKKVLMSNTVLLDFSDESYDVLNSFNIGEVEEANDSGIATYKFKFNGVAFACSMSGLIACGSMCGGLHFIPGVGLAVGGACDFACATAFAVGCAIE
ncbi:putative immunity/bacteriocin fusion bifunctional protein [Kurthia sp. Dielmo]|uniref:putative immunity/bacteriocin fusion bifunctional protein n=1 Tax=Kurthia sp. Dielmo TaxID=1033738 RepID=UPI00111E1D92|nr:putative immunity/bacteriocin fusion bifunctional protein [Kurthia sp. Dielmo]